MNRKIQVYSVAGSRAQRQALEHFVERVPTLRNLGTGNLSSPPPAHADLVLAEFLPGESPPQPLQGPPYWLALIDESQLAWAQLHEGLRATLPRQASPEEIEAALVAVAQGLVVTHPDFTPKAQAPDPASRPLSAREQEVLAFLALGRSNKEIASQLTISEHTVKFHLASLFQKLNASSRSEAVTNGLRRGWVSL